MCRPPANPARPRARHVHRSGKLARRVRPVIEHARAAAFFDLDKTVIAGSSALAFGRPFFHGGLINRRAVARSGYASCFIPRRSRRPRWSGCGGRSPRMCTGWDVAQVHDDRPETLHEIVEPLVYAEAADLIEEHRAQGGRS